MITTSRDSINEMSSGLSNDPESLSTQTEMSALNSYLAGLFELCREELEPTPDVSQLEDREAVRMLKTYIRFCLEGAGIVLKEQPAEAGESRMCQYWITELEEKTLAIDEALAPYDAETDADDTDCVQAIVDWLFSEGIEDLNDVLADKDPRPTTLAELMTLRTQSQAAIDSYLRSPGSKSGSADFMRFNEMSIEKTRGMISSVDKYLADIGAI